MAKNKRYPLVITTDKVEESLLIFKSSKKKEKVLLWLGNIDGSKYYVDEVYEPVQISGSDYFWIPEKGMAMLLNKLKLDRKMIVAQIHTHPFEAFHSEADNRWAIIRHEGAYSLVLPYFSKTTYLRNFFDNVSIYTLNKSNRWIQAKTETLVML